MKPTFPTMTLQRVMITGHGHCSVCNALAPYRVRYGPFLTGAYCWRDLPLSEVVHIRDHPEIRKDPDIMRRIYEAGHAPTFPRKKFNSDDRREMRRHPKDYSEEALREAGVWDDVRGEYEGDDEEEDDEEEDEDDEEDENE